MTDSVFPWPAVRRGLPLVAQMGYGWLKHKVVPRPPFNDQEFTNYSDWLEKTQWWSKAELEALQLERLRALVRHAYENVPYYRRVFDDHGLRPVDIVRLEDLQKLPLLRKEDVRNNLDDLVARNIDRSRLRFVTTSGSTGAPLGLYQDKRTSYLHELAFVYRQRNWAGCIVGDRFVTLRGDVLRQAERKSREPWWQYDPSLNRLTLSSYAMTEENLSLYVAKINDFRPKFIHAYPSSIEILARFMTRTGLRIPVEAIFCGSETVYPEQRAFIGSVFGCPIFARYGMTERAAEAAECEEHTGYHVGMEYGILELIDKNNDPITRPGTPGIVVGSGLDSFCMPLIRYVTDDVAEYAPTACRCKRQSTLIQDFKGRIRELIVSKSGHLVPVVAAASIHGPIGAKIRELTFVQERQGELVVQVARAPAFGEAELTTEISDLLYGKLGKEEFCVKIVFVDHVQRTTRGKLGLLDQRLPVGGDFLDYFGEQSAAGESRA